MAETETKTKKTDLQKATKVSKNGNYKGILIDEGRLYGPFKEYQNVDTDYGKYAVTRGLVMGFELRSVWNKETNRYEDHPFPLYFDAEGTQMQGNGLPLRRQAS